MTTLAIPVFHQRIAPAFDSCHHVLLIDIEHDHDVERSELQFSGLWPSERVTALRGAGANTLICAAISSTLDYMLENAGIRVIAGIAGQIDEVLQAFLSNRLDEPQFFMPGRLWAPTIGKGA